LRFSAEKCWNKATEIAKKPFFKAHLTMIDALSKPIPKKQKPAKAFASPIIPLWPRATWDPEDKENLDGENARKIKLTLSTEPGNLNCKTLNKEFKMFRTGGSEEWILWSREFDKICTGMEPMEGANHNGMVRQLLSDEPLKEFEQQRCSTGPSGPFWGPSFWHSACHTF
jgi:hypothetical protein